MERVLRLSNWVEKVFIMLAVVIAVLTIPVTSVWSAQGSRWKESSFPESRFGFGPADPITKKIRDTTIDPVLDEDTQGRAPASLRALEQQREKEQVNQALLAGIPKNQLGVQEYSLIASETGFYPKVLFVNRDMPVKIYVTSTNKSNCFVLDAFNIRKQVRSHQVDEVTFTPSSSGKFRFSCPLHGREGTLIVKE